MLLASAQAFLLAVSSAVPSPSPEQTSEERHDDRIVVTGSRIGPSPGGLLDRAEIERHQPVSLLEPLQDLAGVRAFSTGGVGGRSFLSIRGGEPNFTLILVEGVKLNDPTNSRGGAFDFFSLDPALVERVEIVRDAVSAIHGSDALSGVVNISLVAPVPGETRLSVRAKAGSEGETDLGGALFGGWKNGGLLAAASRFDSHGVQRGSALERTQALVRLGHRTGGVDIRLLGLAADVDRAAFPEDSGGPRLAVNRALERGRGQLRLAALSLVRSGTGALRPALSLSYSFQRDESVTPPIAPGVLPGTPALSADSRFSRAEALAHVAYDSAHWSAAAGIGWLDETGHSDGTIDLGFPLPVTFRLERETRSAFAELALRPAPGLGITLAARRDDLAGGPGRWTGRIAASWRPPHAAATLFARLSEGYKLPSFYALSHPLIGNPALRPERSRNLEVGIEYEGGEGRLLRAALFNNRFRDLIDFDPILFTTINRDRVRARGAELEVRWPLGAHVILAGTATWLDLESPTPLRGRPEWNGSLRATWQPSPAWELSGAVRANNSFYDSSIPTGVVRAEGHLEVDLGVRYRLSRRLVLDGVLRNLTGSRYEDAIGFPAAGPTLRATLSADLS